MKYDIRRIKEVVSCRDLCENNGIEINGKGRARCVFHDDNRPSMAVFADHVHCYACGAHGDVIDLARKIYGVDFGAACQILSENYGILPVQDGSYRDMAAEAQRRRKQQADKVDALRDNYFRLVREYRRLDNNRSKYAPRSPTESLNPLFVEALNNLDAVGEEMQRAEWKLHDEERKAG